MQSKFWSLWPNITSCYHCEHGYDSFDTLQEALRRMSVKGVMLGTDVAQMAFEGSRVKVLWHRNFEAELQQFSLKVVREALTAVQKIHPLPYDMFRAVEVKELWLAGEADDVYLEKADNFLCGVHQQVKTIPNKLTGDSTRMHPEPLNERQYILKWTALRDATAAACDIIQKDVSSAARSYHQAYEALAAISAAADPNCDISQAYATIAQQHDEQLVALALSATGKPITTPPANQPLSSHQW